MNEPPILEAGGYPQGLPLSESTKVGTEVFVLKGHDPEGSPVKYGIQLTDHFVVNPRTGVITLAKPLNREVRKKNVDWFKTTRRSYRKESLRANCMHPAYLSDQGRSYPVRGARNSYRNILRAASPTSFIYASLFLISQFLLNFNMD